MVRRRVPVQPHGPQARFSNGQLTIMMVLVSEIVFFVGLFFAFFYLRYQSEAWPPPGMIRPNPLVPSITTGLLVTSSLTLIGAHLAIRRDRQNGLQWGLLATLLLGVTFLLGQIYEYRTDNLSAAQNLFGSLYYTLAGFHAAHMIGGLLFVGVVFTRATLHQFSATRHIAVWALGVYWHFITIVWLFLYVMLYWL